MRRAFWIPRAHFIEERGPLFFVWTSLARRFRADTDRDPPVAHNPPMDDFPMTRSWMTEILNHPHVGEWLNEADQLPQIWFDDYLLPGQLGAEAFGTTTSR